MDGIKKISENVIRNGRALTLTGKEVKDYDGIPNGTLRAVKEEQGLQYKIALNSWSKFLGEGLLIEGSITTNLLANKCVTNPKIGDSAVDRRTISDLEVITSKLGNLSVTEPKIAADAVTTPKVKNLNITEEKLGNDSVTEIKIKNQNVTTPKVKDEAITEPKLASLSVSTSKYQNNSITNIKIAVNTIENDKYKDQSIYGNKIKLLGVETKHLNNQSVSSSKLALGAVITDTIGDKQVTGVKIADNTIGNTHLTINSVGEKNLINSSVNTNTIKDGAVTEIKLDPALRARVQDAVVHDTNGHAQVRKAMTIGNGNYTATSGEYAMAINGTLIADRVLNGVYQDIAEAYVPGEKLEEGDVVELREDGMIYKASTKSKCIVGIVSNQYATCFGATAEELRFGEKIAVGLIGKVPVKVSGSIELGEWIMPHTDGTATNTFIKGHAIGKALETNLEENVKEVLCLIYPN